MTIKYTRIAKALDNLSTDELERLSVEVEQRLVDHYQAQLEGEHKDSKAVTVPVESAARDYLAGFTDGHYAGMRHNDELVEKVLNTLSNLMRCSHHMGVIMGHIDGMVIASAKTLPVEPLRKKAIKLGDLLNRADAFERRLVHLLDPDGTEGFTGYFDYSNAIQRRDAVLSLRDGDEQSAAALRNIIAQWQGTAADMNVMTVMRKRTRMRKEKTLLVADAMRNKIVDGMTILAAATEIAYDFGIDESTAQSYYYRMYPKSADLQLR